MSVCLGNGVSLQDKYPVSGKPPHLFTGVTAVSVLVPREHGKNFCASTVAILLYRKLNIGYSDITVGGLGDCRQSPKG